MIFRFGGEDSWIKDKRGVYIEHGVPSNVPEYVKEQQDAILCGFGLFDEFKKTDEEILSQCLGACMNYAVDIVHVPRIDKDDLIENQCLEYEDGGVGHFIELNKKRNIIRIV